LSGFIFVKTYLCLTPSQSSQHSILLCFFFNKLELSCNTKEGRAVARNRASRDAVVNFDVYHLFSARYNVINSNLGCIAARQAKANPNYNLFQQTLLFVGAVCSINTNA